MYMCTSTSSTLAFCSSATVFFALSFSPSCSAPCLGKTRLLSQQPQLSPLQKAWERSHPLRQQLCLRCPEAQLYSLWKSVFWLPGTAITSTMCFSWRRTCSSHALLRLNQKIIWRQGQLHYTCWSNYFVLDIPFKSNMMTHIKPITLNH